jgi:hypothetical protein
MANMVDIPVASGTLEKKGSAKINPNKQHTLYEGLIEMPDKEAMKIVISQVRGHSDKRVLIQLISQTDITDWEFI